MKEMYFTIAGCNHYYGSDFMEKGMKVKLVKEPDNEYDNEAIQVKIKGLGKVGYVANSPYTVKGESMSAGRLYDKIGGIRLILQLLIYRSLSQTMIAEYKTKLIDKSILQRKLAELYDIAEEEVKNSQQD